jgi:glutamate 5-kinase
MIWKLWRAFFVGKENGSNLLVVKIGTNTLVRNGAFDAVYGRDIARQVTELDASGTRTLLVSSGAMALGESRLGSVAGDSQKAKLGQELLRTGWETSFKEHGFGAEEVLVTGNDIEHAYQKISYALRVPRRVPLVNGDDSSYRQSIPGEAADVTNNDVLGQLMAIQFQALYLMLTDVDGILTPQGNVLPEISHMNQVRVFDGKSRLGTGGMVTKPRAGLAVARHGLNVAIANGRRPNVIKDFAANKQVGTRIVSS